MKGSLIASLGFHATILIAALMVLPNSALKEAKPVEAITVDISNIGELTKTMAMAKDAETTPEKPKAKKAEVIKKADPKLKADKTEITAAKPSKPKTEPEPPPEPKPEKKVAETPPEPPPLDSDPLKDLIKDTITEKPPEKKPEKKAEKQPEKKKEKKKEKLDVAKLEDLLNSDALVNKENEQKTTDASEATEDGTPTKGESDLQGTDDQLSATILQALVQRIRECWVVPPGAREASIIVKLRFALNPDGSIAGTPMVMNATQDPLYDVTARSAVAAVMSCQNYDFLPQDKYDLWKDLIINFNPNMMFDS